MSSFIYKYKVILVEIIFIALPSLIYYYNSLSTSVISWDTLISIVFILLLISMFFFRSGHNRHFWMGVLFIAFAALANTLGKETLAYTLSGFAISVFGLGFVNLILFGKKE